MAETGVNIKVGVTGASSVKKDINAIKDSVKTLDKHLGYVEKKFEATGDKEAYMQEKTDDLKGKIEALESIVDKAKTALDNMKKDGVDASSKAFQDMQRTVIDAQTELLNTETALRDAGTEAGNMGDKLGGIGQNVAWDSIAEGIGNITDKLEAGARAAVNFAKKVAKSAMDSTQWADDILTEATKYGTDAETIQKMRNVADFIDTDVDTILNAKDRLAKNKDTLADTLGVNADGKTVDEAFWAAGEAIMAMTDDFEKEEAAQKVFGKGWKDLVPLFTAGQEEYNRLMDEQNVLTNEQVASLGKADDAIKSIQQQIDLMKNQFWAENADKIIELGQWIVDNKDGIVTALGAIAAAFGGLKLAETAANIGKIVSGFQTLGLTKGGGGGVSTPVTGGGGGATGGGGIGLTGWGGIAGLSAIISGFAAAWNRNNFHKEEVRGSEENFAARSGGDALQEALAEYATAYAEAQNDAMNDAAWERLAEAQAKFNSMEGSEEAWAAYTDWLSQNSGRIGDLPDTLASLGTALDDLTGQSSTQQQSNSEMTAAARNMGALPSAVANAVASALNGIGISIDGQTLMGYINTHQAAGVLGQ